MTNAAPVRLLATGASNLARMALPLLAAARARAAGPVEAHFVLGRGRSYGVRSNLLGRGLARTHLVRPGSAARAAGAQLA